MKLASSARPTTPQDGAAFVEQFIFPTLEICERLEDEKKILAGGPVGGAIALAFVIKAESIQELDELIESLPIWPRMETIVTPLASFDGRKAALRSRLARLTAK
jgi:muconolactone delta-isomerase